MPRCHLSHGRAAVVPKFNPHWFTFEANQNWLWERPRAGLIVERTVDPLVDKQFEIRGDFQTLG